MLQSREDTRSLPSHYLYLHVLLQVYTDDTFGLKTLDTTGRLQIYDVPGVQHVEWIKNSTVFEKCIRQWLS